MSRRDFFLYRPQPDELSRSLLNFGAMTRAARKMIDPRAFSVVDLSPDPPPPCYEAHEPVDPEGPIPKWMSGVARDPYLYMPYEMHRGIAHLYVPIGWQRQYESHEDVEPDVVLRALLPQL